MKTIKIDDPRLDESYSFLFAFKKGDVITKKGERAIRGEIVDGVYVGEVPGSNIRAVYSRAKRSTRSNFRTRRSTSSMKMMSIVRRDSRPLDRHASRGTGIALYRFRIK